MRGPRRVAGNNLTVFEDPFDPNAPGLTAQEQRFADHYVKYLNASAAARYAGVSPEAAGEAGWRLVRRPNVRAYVADLLAARNQAEGLDRDRVLGEIVTIGMANMLDYTREDVDGSPTLCWQKVMENPRLGAAIQEVTTETRFDADGNPVTKSKIKLYNKLDALDKLCKHLGLINEAKELGKGLGEGLGTAAVGALEDRDLARRVAFVLSLGLRAKDQAVTIDARPAPAAAAEFADLT